MVSPNRRLFDRSSSGTHITWLKDNLLTQLRDVTEGKTDPSQFATKLAHQIDKLEQEKIRDPLTGAFNRGFIGAVLGQELALVKKEKQALGFILIDLDHFKSINDNEPDGHAAGDRALIEAVKILRDLAGHHSLVGRWGGEEFVVVTPHVTFDGLIALAEDMGQSIGGWLAKNAKLERDQVTASMGVVLGEGNQSPSVLIEQADKLLYAAKEGGRNQLRIQDGTEVKIVKFS